MALTAVAILRPLRAEAQVDLRRLLPSLADGRIASRYLRAGLGGLPTGRAYGLVDAPFEDVMRMLARLGSYASLVPTMRSIRVESRQSGRARIHAQGRAPVLGAYDVRLDASIVGRSDGTHVIELETAPASRRTSTSAARSRPRRAACAPWSPPRSRSPRGTSRAASRAGPT